MSADQIHIINQFLSQFIVPNFYTKEHFYEMTEWSDEKVERFKKYMTDQMCADDSGIKDIVRGYIETFEEEPIDIDEEQEDDEEQIDCCNECGTICHTNDLCAHGIGAGRCCVCQKCYDEMEQEE
jgi:hypothetical protein